MKRPVMHLHPAGITSWAFNRAFKCWLLQLGIYGLHGQCKVIAAMFISKESLYLSTSVISVSCNMPPCKSTHVAWGKLAMLLQLATLKAGDWHCGKTCSTFLLELELYCSLESLLFEHVLNYSSSPCFTCSLLTWKNIQIWLKMKAQWWTNVVTYQERTC